MISPIGELNEEHLETDDKEIQPFDLCSPILSVRDLPINSTKQEYSTQEQYKLTHDELSHFGDQWPMGFKKYKILGRSKNSLVWHAINFKNGKHIALKQYVKDGENDNALAVQEAAFQA